MNQCHHILATDNETDLVDFLPQLVIYRRLQLRHDIIERIPLHEVAFEGFFVDSRILIQWQLWRH